MKKTTIVALCLIGLGFIMIGISTIFFDGDFDIYNTANIEYEEKNFSCSSDISQIVIDETSNMVFVESDDLEYPMIYYFERPDYLEYTITEEDGIFSVERVHNIRNNIQLGENLTDTSLRVYVPKSYTGNLEIKNTSGSLHLFDVTGKEIVANSTSGNITLENIKGLSINVHGSSGSHNCSQIVSDSFVCESTSGSSTLTDISSKMIFVNQTSGSINLSNITSDQIGIKATSGSISGSILGNESDYSISAATSSGSCNLTDRTGGSKELYLKTTSGSINISFTE